jgi:hypothetical protein
VDGIKTPHEDLARLLSSTHRDWIRLCLPFVSVDDSPEVFDFDSMDEGTREYWLALAEAMADANYRKLEPVWAETLENDGRFEYTLSGSCDGTESWHWYRRPSLQAIEPASPWELSAHNIATPTT